MDEERASGCLLGLACGDAVGTTVEFSPRGSFEPLSDMVGGGPFRLPVGAWTDDTSMALCLGASLLEQGGFDPADQMSRYLAWWEEGYMSATGSCFDIGGTVAAALRRFRATGEPYSGGDDPWSAGNGSIMRLAPVVLYFAPDLDQVVHYARLSSRTTHGAAECLEACALLGVYLALLLDGKSKEDLLDQTAYRPAAGKIRDLAEGGFAGKPAGEIKGSGYVVESLEAALWCFWETGSYREAVLAAANLGDDADTTAAICGQLAGAYYGRAAIPPSWLAKLVMRDEIEEMAVALARSGG